jgi:hypothetical protein
MADLKTPQDVITASGVLGLKEYFGITPLTDAPGFSVKRHYPPDSPLSGVVTKSGLPDLYCLIHFVVERPTSPGGVSAMQFSASMRSLWRGDWHRDYDYTSPDCPTSASVQRLKRLPKPLTLDFRGDFFYDAAESRFYGASGQVTGKQILDHVYDYHCRTLRLWFRVKWAARTGMDAAVHFLISRMQAILIWILVHGYDIKLNVPDYEIFHVYSLSDFDRTQEGGATHFFGFQSSKRSLFSNLLILALACTLAYWFLREWDLLRVVYRNTALTTAALVFGFLIADQVVPASLLAGVCALSRLRRATLVVIRKVVA